MIAVWASAGPLYSALDEFLTTRIWGKATALPKGTVMAVARGDTIIAAALFNNYQPEAGTVEITAASDSPLWLSRPMLWEMFSYAFGQLKCQSVILRADPENKRLERVATAYGFTRHELPHLRGKDKAEAIYILTDDAWRGNGFHKENS